MKHKIENILAVLVITMLLLGTAPLMLGKVEAAIGPYYSVEPALKEFGPASCVGQEFTVAVWLHNVTHANTPAGAYGVEFKLSYDPVYLLNVSATSKVALPGGVLNSPAFLAKNIWKEDAGHYYWLAGASLDPAAAWWGDGIVAEVTFKIIKQPLGLLGEPDVDTILDLFFSDLVDFDTHVVPHGPNSDGTVRIHATVFAYPPRPKVEVIPPEYTASALGEHFTIDIYLTAYDEFGAEVGVDGFWDVAAFDITLLYDTSLLDVLSATEGPFLGLFNTGTFGWITVTEGDGKVWAVYTGYEPIAPLFGSGVLFSVTFNVTYESTTYPPAQCDLELNPTFIVSWPHPERMIEPWAQRPYAVELPIDHPLWGHYVNDGLYISPFKPPGAWLDLYDQYPDTFNGKGPNVPSDAFAPQMEVILYAYLTYNLDPIQNKWVAFEIHNALGQLVTVESDYTDAGGIASVSFRIPMPCDPLGGEPPEIFGTWTVTATVSVDEHVVTDTMTFLVGWLFKIISVEPTQPNFLKYVDTMGFKVTFECISAQSRWVRFDVNVVDECNYPIGDGTEAGYFTAGTYDFTVYIPIPKWARVGMATVYVNALTAYPIWGGTPYCPQVSETFGITL